MNSRHCIADIRFSYLAASSLDKALGQGVIHMAKSPYTITRRQPGSCAAYTRKLTYHSAVYLYLTFCRMQRGDFILCRTQYS